jgi:hypothetical protein
MDSGLPAKYCRQPTPLPAKKKEGNKKVFRRLGLLSVVCGSPVQFLHYEEARSVWLV